MSEHVCTWCTMVPVHLFQSHVGILRREESAPAVRHIMFMCYKWDVLFVNGCTECMRTQVALLVVLLGNSKLQKPVGHSNVLATHSGNRR